MASEIQDGRRRTSWILAAILNSYHAYFALTHLKNRFYTHKIIYMPNFIILSSKLLPLYKYQNKSLSIHRYGIRSLWVQWVTLMQRFLAEPCASCLTHSRTNELKIRPDMKLHAIYLLFCNYDSLDIQTFSPVRPGDHITWDEAY